MKVTYYAKEPNGALTEGYLSCTTPLRSHYGITGDLVLDVLYAMLGLENRESQCLGRAFRAPGVLIDESFMNRSGIISDLQKEALVDSLQTMASDGLIWLGAAKDDTLIAWLEIVDRDSTPWPDRKKAEAKPANGLVYLYRAEGTSRYKIGKTRQIKVRHKALQKQSPYPLQLLKAIKTSDMTALERELHSRFAAFQVHGEWFELPPSAVAEICAMQGEG